MDFRGRPEEFVGVGGIRTRYQADVYVCTQNERTFCQFEWYRDNINILPPQMREAFEAVFLLQICIH